MSEHKWMGQPFSELSPVTRAIVLEFFGGHPSSVMHGVNCTGLTEEQRLAAVEALRASGPIASSHEVAKEVGRLLAKVGGL